MSAKKKPNNDKSRVASKRSRARSEVTPRDRAEVFLKGAGDSTLRERAADIMKSSMAAMSGEWANAIAEEERALAPLEREVDAFIRRHDADQSVSFADAMLEDDWGAGRLGQRVKDAMRAEGVDVERERRGALLSSWCSSDASYQALGATKFAEQSWMAGACCLLAQAFRAVYPDAKLVGIEMNGSVHHVGAELGGAVYDALGVHTREEWPMVWARYERIEASKASRSAVRLVELQTRAQALEECRVSDVDVATIADALRGRLGDQAHRNPVDDKVRSARKRYGARAALWGLLTALYAAGRDHEAERLMSTEPWWSGARPDYVLENALELPDLGRTGEGLVGWAAHRYHMAERSGDAGEIRRLEELLPRAAYSVMEWSQRARPRPNLFDLSVEEAYERAKAFLDIQETKGPRQGPVVFRFDDGWTIQDLNSKALLVDEGNHQHICVGQEKHGYPQRVEEGLIKIYSLRDPGGKPHVTMTWDNKRQLYEAAIEHNGELWDNGIRKRCAMFGRSLGMSDYHLVVTGLLAAKDARLAGIDLRDRVVGHIDLSEANLEGAQLSRAWMKRTWLANANLKGADLRGAALEGASLQGANLQNADLEGADANTSNMTGVDLRNANMKNVDLRYASLPGANLAGANLQGVKHNRHTVWPDGFDPKTSASSMA